MNGYYDTDTQKTGRICTGYKLEGADGLFNSLFGLHGW